ncbi:hypothetical protein BS50DRAFT_69780 [Corynespora cassiicola Philippines]|uniref:Uncharacterized protein n=1 Tax=Corynespora cassiicola Philippines TaxID=1448308 RepID=A0A2T2NFT6_CORCC|nr:hypothetical protein BS50DRAFT_69780 [Corynespora cassiicola Philippines]
MLLSFATVDSIFHVAFRTGECSFPFFLFFFFAGVGHQGARRGCTMGRQGFDDQGGYSCLAYFWALMYAFRDIMQRFPLSQLRTNSCPHIRQFAVGRRIRRKGGGVNAFPRHEHYPPIILYITAGPHIRPS